MPRPQLALQMYTVRDDARSDFAGTLRKVARIGYPAVQLAGYGGLSANALKSLLDGFGLKVAGSHVDLSALEGSLDGELEFNRAIGNRDLICPVAPRELRGDVEGYRTLARKLNQIGQRCQEAGFRLSYHNHNFEFDKFDATTGMEILLTETQPKLVSWEPDVYWIAFAKHDPTDWIRRNPGRCPIIHLKDMTAGDNPTYAEVGEGIIDFGPIFEATADAEWYVVEQDTCARPPLESAALSLKHLRDWGK